ncbi:MAG TPA: CRISPR-associated endonuclease Cas1 [bacterium]|nr:CRISPR-associated endonuclease Cas1 [bacterium]
MQRQYSTVRNPKEIVTVTGQNVRLRVRRHQLEITDGFPLEAAQQTRRITRATARVDRVLLLAGSGWASLNALDWTAGNGAAIVACDQGGSLRWVVLPGSGGVARGPLRRSQALAIMEPAGLSLGRYLLGEKIRRQTALLREYADRVDEHQVHLGLSETKLRDTADALGTHLLRKIETADTVETLRQVEAESAGTYWMAYAGLGAKFSPLSYDRIVADHWRKFPGRHSVLSRGRSPQFATDPINACLNYGYALLEAEVLIATHSVGLDPTLGILHVDDDGRMSFIYDLMEPLRPVADRHVLDLILDHRFRPGELWLLRDGRCRLDQEFAAKLRGWLPIFRRAVEPIVAHVIAVLRGTYRDHAKIHPARKVPSRRSVSNSVCRVCGAVVPSGRPFCNRTCYAAWWKEHVQRRLARQGADARAQMRAEGCDPAWTPEARAKRRPGIVRANQIRGMVIPKRPAGSRG